MQGLIPVQKAYVGIIRKLHHVTAKHSTISILDLSPGVTVPMIKIHSYVYGNWSTKKSHIQALKLKHM